MHISFRILLGDLYQIRCHFITEMLWKCENFNTNPELFSSINFVFGYKIESHPLKMRSNYADLKFQIADITFLFKASKDAAKWKMFEV